MGRFNPPTKRKKKNIIKKQFFLINLVFVVTHFRWNLANNTNEERN